MDHAEDAAAEACASLRGLLPACTAVRVGTLVAEAGAVGGALELLRGAVPSHRLVVTAPGAGGGQDGAAAPPGAKHVALVLPLAPAEAASRDAAAEEFGRSCEGAYAAAALRRLVAGVQAAAGRSPPPLKGPVLLVTASGAEDPASSDATVADAQAALVGLVGATARLAPVPAAAAVFMEADRHSTAAALAASLTAGAASAGLQLAITPVAGATCMQEATRAYVGAVREVSGGALMPMP
jgi:hypothetical protein